MDKWIQLQSADGLNNLYPVGKMDLLWANASPSSQFTPQTLPLDISSYKLLCIVSTITITGTVPYLHTSIIQNETGKRLLSATYDIFYDRYIELTANSIDISAGHYRSSYAAASPSTNNGVLVPLYIYGIKSTIDDVR